MNKDWVVVVFQDENSVAVIPNLWCFIRGESNYAYFPSSKNATSRVKRRDQPEESWKTFRVKILTSCGKHLPNKLIKITNNAAS